MTIRPIAIAVVAMGLLFEARSASAGMITYVETATASGSLGGTNFTFAQVTITATADTANIILSDPTDMFYKVTNMSTTVDVAGVGSAMFTDAIFTGVVQLFQVAGFSDPKSEDILDTKSPAFSTYDLSTSIGPLSGTTVINPGFAFPTTAGDLILTAAVANGDSTFQATLAAIPSPHRSFSLAQRRWRG
jgi:hypothetical protein